jgi:hypothetical protein
LSSNLTKISDEFLRRAREKRRLGIILVAFDQDVLDGGRVGQEADGEAWHGGDADVVTMSPPDVAEEVQLVAAECRQTDGAAGASSQGRVALNSHDPDRFGPTRRRRFGRIVRARQALAATSSERPRWRDGATNDRFRRRYRSGPDAASTGSLTDSLCGARLCQGP